MAGTKAIGAKFDFATLKGSEVEVPKQTRARKANPFLPLVAELRESGKAKEYVVPFGTEDEKVAANKWVANVQAAGRLSDVTVRKFLTDTEDGHARVTLWVVDAIKRERGE
jgi:hypothetical protein